MTGHKFETDRKFASMTHFYLLKSFLKNDVYETGFFINFIPSRTGICN